MHGAADSSHSVRHVHEHVFVLRLVRDRSSYSYLLGLYLGDGWVGPSGAKAQLVIRLDSDYPGIVRDCVAAVATSMS